MDHRLPWRHRWSSFWPRQPLGHHLCFMKSCLLIGWARSWCRPCLRMFGPQWGPHSKLCWVCKFYYDVSFWQTFCDIYVCCNFKCQKQMLYLLTTYRKFAAIRVWTKGRLLDPLHKYIIFASHKGFIDLNRTWIRKPWLVKIHVYMYQMCITGVCEHFVAVCRIIEYCIVLHVWCL